VEFGDGKRAAASLGVSATNSWSDPAARTKKSSPETDQNGFDFVIRLVERAILVLNLQPHNNPIKAPSRGKHVALDRA